MADDGFDVDAWLTRIGLRRPSGPNLASLRAIIEAHTGTIPFENIDVLLGRPPRLDIGSLRRKLIDAGRGGYCFEQNTLLGAGLSALGYQVTTLIARVIRGMAADALAPATHMLLRVDLDEGPFLADAGFGNQTPTAPLALRPMEEQDTPHETMRLLPVGDELTLQAKSDDSWQSVYRLSTAPRPAIDFEVANWFTATHPASPFVNHLIVARPGEDGARHTLFNGRVTVRRRGGSPERSVMDSMSAIRTVLESRFGLVLTEADLTTALDVLDSKGTRGAGHPAFT